MSLSLFLTYIHRTLLQILYRYHIRLTMIHDNFISMFSNSKVKYFQVSRLDFMDVRNKVLCKISDQVLNGRTLNEKVYE